MRLRPLDKAQAIQRLSALVIAIACSSSGRIFLRTRQPWTGQTGQDNSSLLALPWQGQTKGAPALISARQLIPVNIIGTQLYSPACSSLASPQLKLHLLSLALASPVARDRDLLSTIEIYLPGPALTSPEGGE
jgi:hypothetical protein